jgi:hypothetical protein
LSAEEINEFMDTGVSIMTGGTAVELQNKLPTAWGEIKDQY